MILDKKDYQIIEQFKAGNAVKKNEVIEEYKAFDIPNVYKNERACEAPTYELYLTNQIELSPDDEALIETLGEPLVGSEADRVRHLESQVMSSEEWYQTVYGKGFFEKFDINELSWYFYDAAILVSKLESANRWLTRLHELKIKEEDRGKGWFKATGVFLVLSLLQLIFTPDKLVLPLLLLLLVGCGYISYRYLSSLDNRLKPIEDEQERAKKAHEWHLSKAVNHPLIRQQGDNSNSFFFDTMCGYVNEGRVGTVQEALNLYHQEMQYNQLLQEQEQIRQQTEQINRMTTVNTIHNVLKK